MIFPLDVVLKESRWSEEEYGAVLAPCDIISNKLGDIVHIDARLFEGDSFSVDQSALIGEFLPAAKNRSDEVFSGSTVKKGEIEAVVIDKVSNFTEKCVHSSSNNNCFDLTLLHS
jgi:H+-transporting ATPase